MKIEQPSLNTIRTSVCVVFHGMTQPGEHVAWPAGAEEFVRRLCKKNVEVLVVGPRPKGRIGAKDVLKFFDRHEVVTMKQLARAKQQSLEFRLIGRRLRAWTRVRADLCVVSGAPGVWRKPFVGWTSNGVLTLDSLSRWVNEFDSLPGRRFLFHGSSNRVFAWASLLLDRGAEACMVVEPSSFPQAWRSHRDRFLAKGGRVFTAHDIVRIQDRIGSSSAVFLKNSEGTLVLDADTIVYTPLENEHLGGPEYWARGLFYAQRTYGEQDPLIDEHKLESELDWSEIYWRVCRKLDVADHGEFTNALERVREERKALKRYRREQIELHYSGKNLTKESHELIRASRSSPPHFDTPKPIASLECFEKLACRACVQACPHDAITKESLADFPQLIPEACVGCGVCVAACPSGAAVMVRELPAVNLARYFLPDDSTTLWKEGDPLQLLNRRGEQLAAGKVIAATAYKDGLHRVLEIESPSYNVWDARSFRKAKVTKLSNVSDVPLVVAEKKEIKRGWITLNGARRSAVIDIPVSVSLWKMGHRRFEDALLCVDGGCRLCKVKVNSEYRLACSTILEEGDVVEFTHSANRNDKDCYCAQASKTDLDVLQKEGVSAVLAQELTGFGLGTCKGRWCHSRELEQADVSAAATKQRPLWFGFNVSPWFEVWPEDLMTDR